MTRLNTDYFDIPEHPPSWYVRMRAAERNADERGDDLAAAGRAYRPAPSRCPFCGQRAPAVAGIAQGLRAYALAGPHGGIGAGFRK